MTNIRIALLDTGISNELIDQRVKLNKQIYYDYVDENIVIKDSRNDFNGHGTACLKTMWDINPHIDIYSINMLGISGTTNSKTFLAALEYAEQLEVDIIAICSSFIAANMSEEVRSVCKRIHDSGKIIIASVENGKQESSIADYDTVIGVIGAEFNKNCYSFSDHWKIQMCCDASCVVTNGSRNTKQIFFGNSRATAIASGIISKMIFDNPSTNQNILQLLDMNKQTRREDENQLINQLTDFEEYDSEKEQTLLNTDSDYQRFIYTLCEFFLFDDPDIIRIANLTDFADHKLVKQIDSVVNYIEDRFDLVLDSFYLDDFRWAYMFYEKHIKHHIV